MNAPSAYFGGRTSMSSDSRRSLIRVRQQQHEEEKNQKKTNKSKQSPASVKQQVLLPNFSSHKFYFSMLSLSLVKVMNLEHLSIPKQLLRRRKNHHQNLRQLRIEKG